MGMTPPEFYEEEQLTQSSFESGTNGPAQVYVGLVPPKMAPTGIYTFELCLESQFVLGG